MNYEWDEKKRAANLEKHGLDFVDAINLFKSAELLVVQDDRKDYGERRFIAYGCLNNRVYVVVYVQCRLDGVRLIPLRKANRREVMFYEKALSK
jgi:uncharacterized DUF497 family protein